MLPTRLHNLICALLIIGSAALVFFIIFGDASHG